jgi:hypothetical protein
LFLKTHARAKFIQHFTNSVHSSSGGVGLSLWRLGRGCVSGVQRRSATACRSLGCASKKTINSSTTASSVSCSGGKGSFSAAINAAFWRSNCCILGSIGGGGAGVFGYKRLYGQLGGFKGSCSAAINAAFWRRRQKKRTKKTKTDENEYMAQQLLHLVQPRLDELKTSTSRHRNRLFPSGSHGYNNGTPLMWILEQKRGKIQMQPDELRARVTQRQPLQDLISLDFAVGCLVELCYGQRDSHMFLPAPTPPPPRTSTPLDNPPAGAVVRAKNMLIFGWSSFIFCFFGGPPPHAHSTKWRLIRD